MKARKLVEKIQDVLACTSLADLGQWTLMHLKW
jgi:hypothetical protein